MELKLGRGRELLAAAFAAAVLISAIAASNALAILTRLPDGQTVSYQPLRGAPTGTAAPDTAFNNVDYNGGPVMPSNTDYLIFWSPSGSGAYPAGYASGLERFFKDLQHDSGANQNVDSVAAQYNDLTGAFAKYSVTYGGAIFVTDPYPAGQCPAVTPVTNCLTDAQIQTELEHVAAVHHLRRDLSHEMFLFTPPHVEGCFTSNPASNPPYGGCSAGEPTGLGLYCAYHQETAASPMLFYADDPYVTGNSGCDDGNHPNGVADGAIEGGLSHEHNESISDPIPNDAWTNGAGSNQGEEIGDQCDSVYGTPLGTHNGAEYNQVIDGHFYWYQEEWSNLTHSCLQRLSLPSQLPSAKFTATATAGSGLAMNFDASGSSAPGGIADYVWQFNAVANAQDVEQTTPTTSYTFPAAGAYALGLTIYASNGLSIGTGGIVTTGHSGFTNGFTYTTGTLSAGEAIRFKGLTTISQQPVTNYLWEWGDGKTGIGSDPKHTYASAGTYRVELVQFSGVGSAYPGAGAAPISVRTVTIH